MDYICMKNIFNRYNKKHKLRKQSASEIEKLNREKKGQKQKMEWYI